MTRHARVLEPAGLRVVLKYARKTQAQRNTVIVLLIPRPVESDSLGLSQIAVS